MARQALGARFTSWGKRLAVGAVRALGKLAPGPANLLRAIFPVSWGEPPTMGTEDLLEGFETMPWLRAISDKVGFAVASLEWQLLAIKGGSGKAVRDVYVQRGVAEQRTKALVRLASAGRLQELQDHVFLQALDDPNPFMGRLGLLKITEIHLDLVGEAYWAKQRNGLGVCVGFWPVPPHWVLDRPMPDRPTYRIAYRSWQVDIPEREMARFLEPSPVNPYTRGSGIGWSLGDELEVDEYAAKMAKALFFNQARPDFVVYGFEDEGEKRRLERDWTNRLQGFWRAHKPYFLTGEPKFHEFQRPNMEQLVYPGLRKAQRDIVMQTWGVPPEMFGISEHGSLARTNYEGAEYVTAKLVIVPRGERIRQVLQRLVIEEYDERIIVHFVSPVAEDKEFKLKVAKSGAVLRRDEWRRMLGEPPVGGEEGNVFIAPPGTTVDDMLSAAGGKGN